MIINWDRATEMLGEETVTTFSDAADHDGGLPLALVVAALDAADLDAGSLLDVIIAIKKQAEAWHADQYRD